MPRARSRFPRRSAGWAGGLPVGPVPGQAPGRQTQWLELRAALAEAAAKGGWPMICVNDRADLAILAAREGLAPWGLHLGQEDLPAGEARACLGWRGLHVGASTHAGWWAAVDPACDHPGLAPSGARPPRPTTPGPSAWRGLRAGCAALRARPSPPSPSAA
ncbi:MAG: thiamine phosphate synthase [Holophagaceae bacterium]|nr:thiamine phosphate synthase [Holophagaceae bacterium]